jgi:hypothetical protein
LLSFVEESFVFQFARQNVQNSFRPVEQNSFAFVCVKFSVTLRVFEDWMLRKKIFVFKRDEVTREWRRLHNEQPYDLYFSPKIIRLIKSRTMS